MKKIRAHDLVLVNVTRAVVVAALVVSCARRQAAAQNRSAAAIARVDPCALLTKEEIQKQLELTGPESEREALKKKGVVWSIATKPEQRGVSRACEVTWKGTVNGDVRRQGDFTVVVTYAAWLSSSVADMKHPLPIPNLGDEAFFVGGKSGPPYARVGDVAIGIEDFPDTKESKSGVELLRAAVPRARR